MHRRLEELTFDQLLEQMHPDTHARLRAFASEVGTTHLVLFQNQMFDSSAFGEQSVLAVGPEHTCQTLEQASGIWLNDLPSQRKYPIAYIDLRQDLGTLTGTYRIVDAFNGLYVYHLPTGDCRGAGDGSEETLDDLIDFAKTDPAGFEEAFGPAPEAD